MLADGLRSLQHSWRKDGTFHVGSPIDAVYEVLPLSILGKSLDCVVDSQEHQKVHFLENIVEA